MCEFVSAQLHLSPLTQYKLDVTHPSCRTLKRDSTYINIHIYIHTYIYMFACKNLWTKAQSTNYSDTFAFVLLLNAFLYSSCSARSLAMCEFIIYSTADFKGNACTHPHVNK